jgi:hypothetical protein
VRNGIRASALRAVAMEVGCAVHTERHYRELGAYRRAFEFFGGVRARRGEMLEALAYGARTVLTPRLA